MHPTSKPCDINNDNLGLHPMNYLSHPHFGIPFLKGMILSCVISAAFNLSYINVIRWMMLCIFFTYWTSYFSSSFCNNPTLPSLCDYVIPYKWFFNDVIGTPNILLAIWIFEPPSTVTIIETTDAWIQFPFFFKFFCHFELQVHVHLEHYGFELQDRLCLYLGHHQFELQVHVCLQQCKLALVHVHLLIVWPP